jgi:hypothetical protein
VKSASDAVGCALSNETTRELFQSADLTNLSHRFLENGNLLKSTPNVIE